MLAFAPNDMWLENGTAVFRFDGVNVTQVLSANSNTIWGTGSDNVWNAAGQVSQWDGKTWTIAPPRLPTSWSVRSSVSAREMSG